MSISKQRYFYPNRRRDVNNRAVRKSRKLAQEREKKTEERLEHLIKENELLEVKMAELSKELNFLKNLFITNNPGPASPS